MSFKVGIPIMKCSLNPSQSINAQTGKKSKTCSVEKAWKEMNNDRIGRDETIDKTMTKNNYWMEGSSQDDVIGMVQQEIDRVNSVRHKADLKSVRRDCVSVISIIEKPSMDYMKSLSYEDKIKFLVDSHKVMMDLIHQWNPNWRVFEAVQHHDEFGGLSPHTHNLIMIPSVNEDGIAFFNAKREVNLKFFSFINKNYPAMMRDLGYDISDCKTYDMLTEEEKEERKLNPPQHGISSQEYKKEHINELTKDYKDLLEENQSLKTELEQKESLIQKLKGEVEKYKTLVIDLKAKLASIGRSIGTRIMKVIGLDVPEDAPEFPSQEVSNEYMSMLNGAKEIDTQNYRVIPDAQDGNYRVAYRTDSGDYKTVKGGFSDRDQADAYRRQLIEAARNMGNELKNGIKNSM